MNDLRDAINNHTQQYHAARQSLSHEKKLATDLEQEILSIESAQVLINTVAAKVQSRVHQQIAAVVSHSLKSVFGDDAYTFRIEFEKKRGRTEARMLFERDGLEVDPLSAAGGGVVDVAAFALRLACVLISRPQLRKLLVLDEPFRHLAPDLRPVALKLMQTLAEKTGTQFVITTQFRQDELDLDIGKVITLSH